MPLLDHFHAPLHPRYPWPSFHAAWASAIMGRLNARLPHPRFFAVTNVHLGASAATDVAEFDTELLQDVSGNGEGGVAVATWAPPTATATIEAIFPDDIEVQIFDTRDGAILVAVVELVSPGNKDRDDARTGFAAKCAAYLQRGIGLVVVDVVTSRHFNLHNALMELLDRPAEARMPEDAVVYATAYRPIVREKRNEIDLWMTPLVVGQALPTLPLALRGTGCVPLELEASYSAARELSRV